MNRNQNIPRLPTELIVDISKHLNIQDKLKLRLINKEFKATFDYLIKLDQLILVTDGLEFNVRWFYTNRRKKVIDLIEFNNTNILNGLFKNNLVLKLKKLSFHSSETINLNTINQLKYLEELNIDCNIESDSILSLSKLRILSIVKYGHYHFKIELETPSLSILRCDIFDYYQFNYPENIIYLEIDGIKYNDQSIEIQQFKNLEYFILNSDQVIEKLDSTTLVKLNHLKELHLNVEWIYEEELIEIKEIYELKSKFKLDNLRIFLYGIDYENLKQFNEDQLIRRNSLDIIFDNYLKTINRLAFITEMNFDKLFEFLNSNPTISLDEIIYKFPIIQCIHANHVNNDNIDCFLEYLSKYDYLNELDLKLKIDNQIYYLNKLPDLCNRIKYLHLNFLNVNESTNLDFLFKFKSLYHLSLGKLDDVNILKNLSDNLNVGINCEFIYKENSFTIHYKNDICMHHYHFKIRINDLFKFFDNLINHRVKPFSYRNCSIRI